MSMQAGDFAYIGVGKVHLKRKCANEPMLHIGNVSALSFGVSEDVKEQKDYTAPGGGTTAESRRITAVEVSMTLLDLDKDNIARAFFGSASNVPVSTVINERHLAFLGGLIPTDHPINETEPVTVKIGATTIAAAGNYTVSSGGITIDPDAEDIDDEDELLISYKNLEYGNVEGITQTAQEYELFFEGLNEAKSGSPVNVHAHKVKFGPTTALNLINDDFASFEVKGKLLRDNCKKGKDTSKYFKVQIVKPSTVDCCDEDNQSGG